MKAPFNRTGIAPRALVVVIALCLAAAALSSLAPLAEAKKHGPHYKPFTRIMEVHWKVMSTEQTEFDRQMADAQALLDCMEPLFGSDDSMDQAVLEACRTQASRDMGVLRLETEQAIESYATAVRKTSRSTVGWFKPKYRRSVQDGWNDIIRAHAQLWTGGYARLADMLEVLSKAQALSDVDPYYAYKEDAWRARTASARDFQRALDDLNELRQTL